MGGDANRKSCTTTNIIFFFSNMDCLVVALVGLVHRHNGLSVDELVGLKCDLSVDNSDVLVGNLGAMRVIRTLNLSQSIAHYGVNCLESYEVHTRVTRAITCNDPYMSYQNYLYQSRFTDAWTYVHDDASPTYVIVVDDGIGDHFELPIVASFPLASTNIGYHATRVAGTVASQANNIALCGASPHTQLVDINLLARSHIGDASEALAFTGDHEQWNAVYCNSWGPMDDGRCEKPGALSRSALDRGVTDGRSGLGSIYVFATGNGGKNENMNDDGYANLPHTIAVAGLDGDNSAYFSEWGAAITLSAPGYQLLTTSDKNQFAYFHGTSSSAPLVAAAISLILGMRPDLSWRDIQEILMMSAAPVGTTQDYSVNAAHFPYSHIFGAGQLDASMAVQMASYWLPLPEQLNVTVVSEVTPLTLPRLFMIPLVSSLRTEHVSACVRIRHPGIATGNGATIGIILVSPVGTRSVLTKSTMRVSMVAGCSYDDWCFTSLANWGEQSSGVWKLLVEDSASPPQSIHRMSLTVFGSDMSYGFSGCKL